MDFKKIMDIISASNINQEEMYKLVDEASKANLKDEASLRKIIRRGAHVANKEITPEQEDKIVKIIKEKGITPDLINFL